MKAKVCRQCGDLKPIEQFRKYYGGRKGTYTLCKQCERINSREKYLSKKEALSSGEQDELSKIHALYEAQEACGLRPPKVKRQLVEDIDAMIAKYTQPTAIDKWLTAPLTKHPDYYIDEVYEQLVKTYKQPIGIDQKTLLPIYNEDYTDKLARILDRFYEYEENYYD